MSRISQLLFINKCNISYEKSQLNLIISRDLNAHVGHQRIETTVETFGVRKINKNGKRLVEFCGYNDLRIMNTFFKHRLEHKYAWSARELNSLVDYIIVNGKTVNEYLDVRPYRGESIDSDHHLLQGTF